MLRKRQSLWERVHTLTFEAVTASAAFTVFEGSAFSHGRLRKLGNPLTTLDAMTAKGCGPGKNGLYKALVRVTRRPNRQAAKLSSDLILLSVWPALSNVYERQRFQWRADSNEMACEVVYFFYASIRKIDLKISKRIPVTLVRNTERDIKKQRIVRRREDAKQQAVEDHHAAVSPEAHLEARSDLQQMQVELNHVAGKRAEAVLTKALFHDSADKRWDACRYLRELCPELVIRRPGKLRGDS